MSESQCKVEANGEVGTTYTTRNGMEVADPEVHSTGWKQETPNTRVRMEAHDIGMHQRWWVWRKVQ